MAHQENEIITIAFLSLTLAILTYPQNEYNDCTDAVVCSCPVTTIQH